jgi:hypothetical protein
MSENKNKSFDCRGNDEADALLCMLESNSVLSESFQNKIRRIVLVILTNLKGNEDWVDKEILKLKQEMNWLLIFSDDFIFRLNSQLILSMQKQLKLNEQENNK